MDENLFFEKGYSNVNGLSMYYEIHGEGKPLVLIHGGGSTIQTSFGKIIPELAKHRKIIAVELQAHGRTGDRNIELRFEQDADDVAALLNNLKIASVDILGYSNGGHTAIEMALRHPVLINKIILASTFFNRDAASPEFWEGFNHATLDHMPQPLREAQLLANGNDAAALQNMFNRDVQRMKSFKGWTDEQMKSIKHPVLIINANADVGSIEHAVEMHRIIPNSQLVVFPGGHGGYLGAVEGLDQGKWKRFNAVPLIEEFLDKD
jgi:pimeloyl-ACP methyl ester carboxylesterase